MLAPRLDDNDEPAAQLHGIMVYLKEDKGSVWVMVRQHGQKEQRYRLAESHAGENGGEFRFDLGKRCE